MHHHRERCLRTSQAGCRGSHLALASAGSSFETEAMVSLCSLGCLVERRQTRLQRSRRNRQNNGSRRPSSVLPKIVASLRIHGECRYGPLAIPPESEERASSYSHQVDSGNMLVDTTDSAEAEDESLVKQQGLKPRKAEPSMVNFSERQLKNRPCRFFLRIGRVCRSWRLCQPCPRDSVMAPDQSSS